MPAADSVAQAVRAGDRDRYLSTLYAPEPKRADLLALYAFDIEVAMIRDRIREALPGEIRLQWWRDALLPASSAATGHPVADALKAAIARHGLPQAAFENYLEARLFDLYDDPMPSRTDLEGYCGETAGAVFQLAALILDREAASSATEIAGHAGCALAIARLLQDLPRHRARGQCHIPRDLLAAAGTTAEEFVGKEVSPAMANAVDAMAALAADHHAAFTTASRGMPPSLRPAFLPVAVVPLTIAAVRKRGRAALELPTEIAAWKRQWAMFRSASR